MADKLVAVRIKQQNNTYSNEIPIGAWAENVAYDNTKNLLQVLGTIDMYKGDVQTQLNALFENFNEIAEDVTGAIDNWIKDNMPSWNPENHLDFSLASSTQAAAGSAVPKLIAINETDVQGTKMKISTTGQQDLTVLTPNDIDNTLSQQGEAADAKATGEMIMINNAAAVGTKIRITTTDEDITLATEEDINGLNDEIDNLKESLNKQQTVLSRSETVVYADYTLNGFYISPSVGTWIAATAYGCGIVPLPDNIYSIEVKANDNFDSLVGFLTTNDHTDRANPDWASGETGLRTVIIGTTDTFDVPDDCRFLYIYYYKKSGTDNARPESVVLTYLSTPIEADNTLSVSGAAADAKTTGDKIDQIWDGLDGKHIYNQQSLINQFGLYSTGLLYSAGGTTVGELFPSEIATTEAVGSYAVMIDVSNTKNITYPIYANNNGRGCLMLDSNYKVTRKFPHIGATTGTAETINIISGEKYFVFGVNSALAAMTWTFTITKEPIKGVNDLNTDMSNMKDEINQNRENVVRIINSDLFQTPKLNAEIVGFICYGQSWSMGYDAKAIVSSQRYDNLMLDSGLMNNPATDLNVSATAFSPLIEQTVWSSTSHSQKCGETPCTGQTDIVKQLLLSENGISYTDVKYQIFSAAPGMGSTSIEQLSKGTDYYNRLIDVVEAANTIARTQDKVFIVPAISWTQGNATTDDDTYYDKLEQLRSDLDTDIKAITGQTIPVKIIAWQAITSNHSTPPSRYYDRFVYASEKYENIICSGTYYMFDHINDTNLHLTTNSQDWLGCQLGIAYKRSIIDGKKFIPLKPKSVEVYGNIAYLDFYVPVKPLVFDTTLVAEISNMGFQIFDNSSSEKTITSVQIISPDRVKIVCASNFTSTDHIVYGGNGTNAYNPQTGKRGNLRDSQPIVYRNHNNVNLPCYNWCVVFDKTIAELTPSL